jgi:hypothetical protein
LATLAQSIVMRTTFARSDFNCVNAQSVRPKTCSSS